MKLSYKFSVAVYFLIAALSMVACRKDYSDPSRATEDKVFSSPKGLTGVAISLQRVYTSGRASSLYNRITADAFVTNQVILLNPGNVPELQLSQGGSNIDGTNTILAGLWTSSSKILYDANRVIQNAEALSDKGFSSGLIGYATIFKAMALGDLAQFWEKIPDTTGANVGFIDRTEGFKRAVAAIDKALASIGTTPISSTFLTTIPAGVDIVNTLHALKARYSLFAGNYAQALASANMVDLTKKSAMNFDALTLNPIFETVTSTNNVYQPVDSTLGLPVGLQPDPSDKRVSFYTSINTSVAPRFRISGFGAAANTSWPLYLPGEITLIKAEVYARQNQVNDGLMELNKVVTKKPGQDLFAIGADLPAINGPLTQAQLLEQIYKHRQIELYMMGFKLEDMRRFNRPTAERKRNFFPYPFRERDNNPNTPADPTF